MHADPISVGRRDRWSARSVPARVVGYGVLGVILTVVWAAGWGQVEAQPAAGDISVTDLGPLPGGYYASARAANNLGQVTGAASDASGALQQVIWSDGTIITGPDWSSWSWTPEAINDSRQVVGNTNTGRSGSSGILWDANGQVFALPPVPGGDVNRVKAHDINASGVIVGRSRDVSLRHHCVVWHGTTLIRDLGFMGSGTDCEAYGINDLGDIVGMANSVSGGQLHGFLWRNGSFTDLGGSSTAVDINNSGLIAGTSGGIAVVWRNGVMETLPALTGGTTYNFVTGLNNNGDVVGYGQSPSGVHLDTPILWRGSSAIDLGRWPAGTFSRAYGINDNGQVVGEGNLADGGAVHALRWTVATPSANTAPAVTLAATSATTITRGGSLSVTGSVADPDGGPWTYTFDWGNGTTSGTMSAPGSVAATRTYATAGRYKVTMKVTDSRGASGTSAVVTVRVR